MFDVIVIVTSVFKTAVFFIDICCFIIVDGILAAYLVFYNNVSIFNWTTRFKVSAILACQTWPPAGRYFGLLATIFYR